MSTCAAWLKRRVEEPAASVEVRSNALSEGIVRTFTLAVGFNLPRQWLAR